MSRNNLQTTEGTWMYSKKFYHHEIVSSVPLKITFVFGHLCQSSLRQGMSGYALITNE